ncbi:hypothetical protein CCYA_CCYA02G0785 [Cyanidiococcus yangmingshanensis]|nr:hypothetical protein CCYA_CCYA02G0785 [Cyanidiococcus yangmingshanensis]
MRLRGFRLQFRHSPRKRFVWVYGALLWCLCNSLLFSHRTSALVYEPRSADNNHENCVLENLYAGQQVRAKFYSVRAGSALIRARATTLSGDQLTATAPAPVAELAFEAPADGDYCFCWSSEPRAVPVGFSFSVPRIPELETILQKGHLVQAERSLFALAQALQELKQRVQLTIQEDFRTRQSLYGHSWRLQITTLAEMFILFITIVWRVVRIQSMFREHVPESG